LMTISLEDIVFNTKLKTIVLIANWRCYFNSKSHEMDPYSIPTFPIMMLFSLLHLLVLLTMPHTNIRNLTKVLSILTQLTTIINYVPYPIVYELFYYEGNMEEGRSTHLQALDCNNCFKMLW
jgi:hypothetical protein